MPLSRKRSVSYRSLPVWVLAILVFGIGWCVRQSGAAEPSSGPPPASVAAVAVKQGDIHIYLTGLGTVVPVSTVTIKTRVDGELVKVAFQEGQTVARGQLLAEIDPRPFQAQLTQAEGVLARDQAQLDNARLDLQRFEILSKQDSIARQQFDTQKALVRQLEGTVKFDQGQMDNAKLQLAYARITAPTGGRIGLRLVDPGNIVHATDANGLAVITQLEPITVVFTIPEDSLPPVLAKLKAGDRLAVDALNREQTQKLASGHLLTVDNQIDPTTGTVRLKAEFPNKSHELFPNQFVNARLLLDIKRGATIVPTASVQRSPQGPYVYLIKSDQTVTVRQVRLGPAEGDHVSVEEGLAPDDLIVLEGAERLREGSRVNVRSTSQKGS